MGLGGAQRQRGIEIGLQDRRAAVLHLTDQGCCGRPALRGVEHRRRSRRAGGSGWQPSAVRQQHAPGPADQADAPHQADCGPAVAPGSAAGAGQPRIQRIRGAATILPARAPGRGRSHGPPTGWRNGYQAQRGALPSDDLARAGCRSGVNLACTRAWRRGAARARPTASGRPATLPGMSSTSRPGKSAPWPESSVPPGPGQRCSRARRWAARPPTRMKSRTQVPSRVGQSSLHSGTAARRRVLLRGSA
jgi:hypothetical protein